MFDAAKIEELTARKRLLVAESNLTRRSVIAEFGRLRTGVMEVEAALRTGNRVSRMLMMGTSMLTGLLTGKKENAQGGWFNKILIGVQWLTRMKGLLGMLRTSRQPKTETESNGPAEG